MPCLQQLGRLASIGGVFLILYLSLVPGEARPHVLPSGGQEHFIAYLGEALLVAFAHWRTRTVVWWHAGLCILAGACELAQNFIPDRGPGWTGFIASSVGVAVAVGLFMLAKRVFR
ncbi:hypothetical protein ASF65_07685 [Aureimonas sp. Leaf324]|nr:hypothetical protein ASF65_07685 [Aureimonas sp. Leaf324]